MNCLLCNKKAKKFRSKIRNSLKRNVYRCEYCSLEFLEANNDNLEEWYRKDYRKDHSPTISNAKSSNAKLFFESVGPTLGIRIEKYKKYLKKNYHVLDVGCAAGAWLHAMKPFVKKVSGVELNREHAKFVQKELNIDCFNDQIQFLNEDIKYDLITCFHTLEHIADPFNFIEEIKKRLKPKGKVIFEVPNLDDVLISTFDNNEYKDFYYTKPHLFYYNNKTLMKLFNKAGFVGKNYGIHRYNYGNLMHWEQQRFPQASNTICMAEPSLKINNNKLNDLIKKQELDYKSLLEKKLISEAIYFVGSKK